MTSQDTVHINITEKISKLRDIYHALTELGYDRPDTCDDVLEEYIRVVTPVLATDPSQYNTALVRSNIIGKINAIERQYRSTYNEIVIRLRGTQYDDKQKSQLKHLKEKLEIVDRMYQVRNGHLRVKKKRKDINSCPECKESMDLIPHLGKYRCPKCDYFKTAHGYVPPEVYLDHAPTTKSVSSYRQDGNCDLHLNKLQGIDSKDIPADLICRLQELATRDKAILSHKKTCRRIRAWLKELGETGYNDHVAKIRYMMTGLPPEQMTPEETELTRKYFPLIMDEYNIIKSPNRKNSCYQPHIILKILEQIIERDTKAKEERFLRIISNIHFQDSETITKNDKILRRIFKKIGLKFTATSLEYYSSYMD